MGAQRREVGVRALAESQGLKVKKQEPVGQGHSLIFIEVCKCLVPCGGFKYLFHVQGSSLLKIIYQ